MQWLIDWSENYSLAILFIGILICLVSVVIYLIYNQRVLTKELRDKEMLEVKLQEQNATIATLSKELANQIEYEIAERLKSDNAHNYLFENTQNAIVIAQDSDLKIIKCNKASLQLFNKEILNHNLLELFSDKTQKILVYDKILKLKETNARQTLRLNLIKESLEIPVVLSIHFLEYAQKRTLYLTLTDIKDIAKLELELRNKRLMLAQKTKNEEMGKMLGNIAHQWKQPLNSLYLLCQNLKELQKLGDYENFPKYLQIALDQIAFLSNTIDAFREFYIPNKSKEELCVYSVIKNTLDLFYKLIDKNIEIELLPYKNPSEIKISVIKNEFQQILLILLDNAIDAIKTRIKKGEIESGRIQIRCVLEENIAKIPSCAVYIKDNGGGIPPKFLKNIFDTFFTTKQSGNGIGLSIVTMLLENMQGRISFINEKDGVEFKIEIPSIV
ncbi:MAG: PAS domain-containing sensor histidine kinase [Helicobacteraceae bacterium]|nr:PAS domain-containing sensor histidine kinase [Helicobacteraceae bacterium]